MEIYFKLQKGYFLTEKLEPKTKSKIQLGDKATKDLLDKEMLKGLTIALLGENSDLKVKVGDRILPTPDSGIGQLNLPTSEGDKVFWLFHDSSVVGIFTDSTLQIDESMPSLILN